ncbi:MAG TPA: HAMP domain-containing sensor histidine kinase [Thermoanaerobaculia bacterium]
MTADSIHSRNSAQKQFLRSFLHDVATPLSAVSLHLEGARRRLSRGDDPGDSLDVARSELVRAFELFERARELLLFESAADESFEFDAWVAAIVRDVAGDRSHVEGWTGGRISGDRARLSEALSSLVANALEHGSSEPIAVFRERDGSCLQVRVENAGHLPGQDPDKLFAPRSTSAGKNWGMGLALARLYAADAGGSVRLCQNGDRVSATLSFPEEPA